MKRIISLTISLLLVLLSAAFSPLSVFAAEENEILYVYNWGEYISDGSDDSLDVNEAFEVYCREKLGRNVEVNYSTFSSNESLYAKITSGAVSYDVIFPSDYMAARLISEGRLAQINPSENLANYEYISDEFKGLYYDEAEKYTVPYTFGTVGVIYNTDIGPEDEELLGSWGLLWDEEYKGNILQFNNPRDAFGSAQYYLGNSVNSTDPDEWRSALDLLLSQKQIVQGYVMDEIFNKMKGGSAAIAPYYAGDYFTMYGDNDALSFYHPSEGTNVFVDVMCIPKTTQNYDLAVEYINFMLSEEAAIANAEYICYASPNTLVTNSEEYASYMTEEIHPDAMSILYDFDMEKMEFYHDLSDETRIMMNSLWEELKIESNIGTAIYVICGVIIVALVAAFLVNFAIKRKHKYYYDTYYVDHSS